MFHRCSTAIIYGLIEMPCVSISNCLSCYTGVSTGRVELLLSMFCLKCPACLYLIVYHVTQVCQQVAWSCYYLLSVWNALHVYISNCLSCFTVVCQPAGLYSCYSAGQHCGAAIIYVLFEMPCVSISNCLSCYTGVSTGSVELLLSMVCLKCPACLYLIVYHVTQVCQQVAWSCYYLWSVWNALHVYI